MRVRPILLTAAAAIVFTACGGGGATTAPATSAPTMSAEPSMAPMTMEPSMAPSPDAVVTDSAAADLRTALDLKLGEHIIFAAKATGAALDGRADEFAAYGGLLNTNGTDLGEMIGSVYGDAAKDEFNRIWSAHNGFFVDYTQGVAAKDQAKQDQAVANLVQYTQDFGAFLNAANPNLPKAAVADLVKTHVLTLKAVVDAQAAGDQAKAYMELRTAFAHMSMIANPLTDAIAQQFPAKFGADAAMVPAVMPNTGMEVPSSLVLLALAAMFAGAGAHFVRRSRQA